MQTATPDEAVADELLRAWQEEVFWKYGFPGLSLLDKPQPAPVPPLQPLINRCACGKPISANKSTCLACSTKE